MNIAQPDYVHRPGTFEFLDDPRQAYELPRLWWTDACPGLYRDDIDPAKKRERWTRALARLTPTQRRRIRDVQTADMPRDLRDAANVAAWAAHVEARAHDGGVSFIRWRMNHAVDIARTPDPEQVEARNRYWATWAEWWKRGGDDAVWADSAWVEATGWSAAQLSDDANTIQHLHALRDATPPVERAFIEAYLRADWAGQSLPEGNRHRTRLENSMKVARAAYTTQFQRWLECWTLARRRGYPALLGLPEGGGVMNHHEADVRRAMIQAGELPPEADPDYVPPPPGRAAVTTTTTTTATPEAAPKATPAESASTPATMPPKASDPATPDDANATPKRATRPRRQRRTRKAVAVDTGAGEA
ncbi:MAG: hypothetical protein HRU76_00050 [Phycisphaeraceae bacterium]|nr:hypothetical protein [Phycisphaerales bacterium]QOJ16084.1 MAG: hypothetical protein HRU76_00050 [Phycisphaeraceae bacterium]